MLPEYNILKVAGSSLGRKHTEEAIALMSLANSGENNPMFGRIGKNHPMFGKTHTPESKALMSLAKKGIAKSEETRAKMSVANGTAIYVYSKDKSTLVNSFSSASKAAKHFYVDKGTVLRYARNTGSGSKIFKEQWILSTCLITQKVNSDYEGPP
jgi:group I intron endonuclease